MNLSERLLAVSQMITLGCRVADVGCDHGYLSIYLIKKNIASHVIAMDINKGPMQRAYENVVEYGVSSDIEIRLSDGLDKLVDNEVDSIVIAGMGGPLMVNILIKGAAICDKVDELILQPQSDIGSVRRFLENSRYRIVSEDIVYEDGKFYPIIKAIHGNMVLEREIYYRYGKILLNEQNPVLYRFLLKERDLWRKILDDLKMSEKTEKVEDRISEVTGNIMYIEEAIAMYN